MTGKNDKKTIIPGHLLTSVILADIMALLLHITIKDKGKMSRKEKNPFLQNK